MKKLAFSLVLAISATFGAQAQNNLPAIPEWEARPAVHPLPPQYNNEHAVIVLEDYTINYIYEAWDLQMYRTIHRIVKVMDRIGIESFNTVEIPLNTLIDSVKARTILPDGTIRDINSDMMHITRGANGGLKLIFAMEAVEKNAEIELLIHDMSNTRVFGAIQLQHAISVLHSVFRMNYPRDAAFEVKGYNGCPTPKEEATNNRKHITIYQQNLAALEPVPYADCDRYSMRVEYRLQHWINRVNQPSKEYDWNNFAENLYNNYYNLTAADRKAAMRFLTIAGIKGDESELTKIRKIEEAVKTKIVRSDFMDDDMGTNLDTVLDRRSATADGMLKLMSACFSLAGVTHELGYTSDRTENLIEASFPNYAIASQPVYYFPSFKTFLSPLAAYLRYPEVPWYLTGNLGVFCATNPSTGYSFGKNERVAEAKLRNIPAGKAESNVTTVTTNINLTTATEPKAEITTSYMGYRAANLRNELAHATADKYIDIVYGTISVAKRKDNLLNYTVSKQAANDAPAPLVIAATVLAPQLTEKAAGKTILRIGDVMGKQKDLYDNKPRTLPVDFNYPHTNKYVISVQLPANTKVENLQALNTYAEQTELESGAVTAYFSSNYELKNNVLTVTVTENYSRIHYSLRDYSSIRKVINAAADFSQVSVILDYSKTKPVKKVTDKPVSLKK